jgi:UV DNA damage endonuclease
MRISMHPDQFIVVNSPREEVFERSVAELTYHATVLDLLNLDTTAKIQLHVGGVYGDKSQSIQRFIDRFASLNHSIRRRLVIENDEKSYHIQDCLQVSAKTDIPILFDYFHHSLLHNHEPLDLLLRSCQETWMKNDGIPMVDYSSQKPNKPPGAHAENLDPSAFTKFLLKSQPYDFDLMLEIKDKERSAMQAFELLKTDPRLISY